MNAIVELAPGHKIGLPSKSPIWLACGTLGYGEAVPRGVDLAQLGGIVVGPVLRRSSSGSSPPRYAEHGVELVVKSGIQSRGLGATRRRYARLWPKMGCPVIVQVAEVQPRAVAEVIEQLAEEDGVAGFELLLPQEASADETGRIVHAACESSDLPVWAKVPLVNGEKLAERLVTAGASALVVAQAPRGVLLHQSGSRGTPDAVGESAEGGVISGDLMGLGAFPLMLDKLYAIKQLGLPCVLIGCGGIHSLSQVKQVLALGGSAVQIDSAFWVEPGIANWLAAEYSKRG
jgi:dihydroorotate dehydrogenase (NAD+) catalytic subunit